MSRFSKGEGLADFNAVLFFTRNFFLRSSFALCSQMEPSEPPRAEEEAEDETRVY